MSDERLGRLAKGSLFSRLFGQGRQPLRLVAVPRDHVAGNRARGDALVAGKFVCGSEEIALSDVNFGDLGARSAIARDLQGFSWLRDLAASASREKGARLAEKIMEDVPCDRLPTVLEQLVRYYPRKSAS